MGENQDTSNASDLDGDQSKDLDEVGDLTARVNQLDEEIREISRKRDGYRTRAQEAERALDELKHSNARESNDLEALEASWKSKVDERDNQLSRYKTQFLDVVIERDVYPIAAERLTDPELFFLKHKADLQADYDEETGKAKIRVKDSADTPADLVARFAERHPNLSRSNLKPGTGGNRQSGTTSQGSAPTLEQVRLMSSDERRRVFMEHPELADKVLGG